jgi:hypothetical protein
MSGKGVLFTMLPKKQDFGRVLAQFVDSEAAHSGTNQTGIEIVHPDCLPITLILIWR